MDGVLVLTLLRYRCDTNNVLMRGEKEVRHSNRQCSIRGMYSLLINIFIAHLRLHRCVDFWTPGPLINANGEFIPKVSFD
jgi:hypothetical protein